MSKQSCVKIIVSVWAENDKGWGCLTERNPQTKAFGGKEHWFPKSVCSLEDTRLGNMPVKVLTVPTWLLYKKVADGCKYFDVSMLNLVKH